MWHKKDNLKTGYKIDDQGYIIEQVKFMGDTPKGVITTPFSDDIENPRWDGTKWVDGDEYVFEKDPVDALAEELLDFKIAYSSVPCQYHQDYPVLIKKILEGDDE